MSDQVLASTYNQPSKPCSKGPDLNDVIDNMILNKGYADDNKWSEGYDPGHPWQFKLHTGLPGAADKNVYGVLTVSETSYVWMVNTNGTK